MSGQSTASDDILPSHTVSANDGENACLRDGDQYRRNLRDGRRVIM